MKSVGNLITRQCKVLLENKHQAIIYAVVFSILPFASWLSISLVCLVTLRKGAQSGFEVMLPALVVHSVPLMMLIPISSAIINTILAYVPCYFAALALRKTEKWQFVFGVFFIQVLLGCLFIELAAPHFIGVQFEQFKLMLTQYQDLLETSLGNIDSLVLAHLFFGVELSSVVVSAVISLIFARSMQAKLFLPGGFGNELIAFRSGKFSFSVLCGVLLAAFYKLPLALNVLPMMLCYFFISGLSLTYFICAHKRQVKLFVLLLLCIMLRPTLVLSAYIILGALDSIFNFRSYLPRKVSESI